MSKFDPLGRDRVKPPPGQSVDDFQVEDFSRARLESAGLSGPPPPLEADFDELRVDQKPLSKIFEELPSLDYLFKPFDLKSDGQADDVFHDLELVPETSSYAYEDLDTRDPEVVRTLAQAEEKRRDILEAAERDADGLRRKGALEEARLLEEAQSKAQVIVAEGHRQAETLLAEAEAQRGEAENTRKEAETFLDEARRKAEESALEASVLDRRQSELAAERASLTDQAAQVRESARQEGLQEGLIEGRELGCQQGQAAFQNQVAGLLSALDKVENLYQELWRANEPLMIKLAIEAAEQIVNKELKQARDLTVRAFEASIDFLSQAHQVTFLAQPEDLKQLELARNAERDRLGGLVKVHFKADSSLGPGDLIMESDVGRLDATIKTRLDKVLSVLRTAFDDSLAAAAALRPPAASSQAPPADDRSAESGLPPEEPESPPEAAAGAAAPAVSEN